MKAPILSVKIFNKGDIVPDYVLRASRPMKMVFAVDNVMVARTVGVTYVTCMNPRKPSESVVDITEEDCNKSTDETVFVYGYLTHWTDSLDLFVTNCKGEVDISHLAVTSTEFEDFNYPSTSYLRKD